MINMLKFMIKKLKKLNIEEEERRIEQEQLDIEEQES